MTRRRQEEAGGGRRGGVGTANYNYTHTCRRTIPHTGIPPSTQQQQQRNIRKQRAQIKASRPAWAAAAAQKGLKAACEESMRDESKGWSWLYIYIYIFILSLSSVFPLPLRLACITTLTAPVHCILKARALQVDAQELYRNRVPQTVHEKQTADVYMTGASGVRISSALGWYYFLPTSYCLRTIFPPIKA